MEKARFSQVTNLKKDDQGIWRASAKQGDKQTNVALDFSGAMSSQQSRELELRWKGP